MVPTIFDYSAIPADVAEALRGQAERIRARIARSTADMLETGRDLLAAKAQVKHGEFTAWVETELGITVRSAQTMMRAAEIAAESENFSLLQPSVALTLAAPAVPAETRKAFTDRAAAGERIPVKAVKAELARLRDEREAAEWQAKLDARSPQAKAAEKRRWAKEKEEGEQRRQAEQDERDRKRGVAVEFATILRGRLSSDEWERAKSLLFGADAPYTYLIWQVMGTSPFWDTDRDDYMPPAFRAYDSVNTAHLVAENARLAALVDEYHADAVARAARQHGADPNEPGDVDSDDAGSDEAVASLSGQADADFDPAALLAIRDQYPLGHT